MVFSPLSRRIRAFVTPSSSVAEAWKWRAQSGVVFREAVPVFKSGTRLQRVFTLDDDLTFRPTSAGFDPVILRNDPTRKRKRARRSSSSHSHN